MGSITIIHIQQYPVWRSHGVSPLSVVIGMDILKTDEQSHTARIPAAISQDFLWIQ